MIVLTLSLSFRYAQLCDRSMMLALTLILRTTWFGGWKFGFPKRARGQRSRWPGVTFSGRQLQPIGLWQMH